MAGIHGPVGLRTKLYPLSFSFSKKDHENSDQGQKMNFLDQDRTRTRHIFKSRTGQDRTGTKKNLTISDQAVRISLDKSNFRATL